MNTSRTCQCPAFGLAHRPDQCRTSPLGRTVHYGYRCAVCGWKPDRLDSWRHCGPDHFCSTDCAVTFLLEREARRAS